MILVSYDGFADAQAAIDRVAELMPGAEATVLFVREPFADALARSGAMGVGVGMAGRHADSDEFDASLAEAALATAAEGARRATAAGLVAHPRSAARDGGGAPTILATADDVEADVIVTGAGGLGGVKSLLLGSVSHAVVQHADRAVLVVPSLALAERRHAVEHDAVPVSPGRPH